MGLTVEGMILEELKALRGLVEQLVKYEELRNFENAQVRKTEEIEIAAGPEPEDQAKPKPKRKVAAAKKKGGET